jgi:hypothetical protein
MAAAAFFLLPAALQSSASMPLLGVWQSPPASTCFPRAVSLRGNARTAILRMAEVSHCSVLYVPFHLVMQRWPRHPRLCFAPMPPPLRSTRMTLVS